LSIRSECLGKIIPLGERHLRRVVLEFVEHYHCERNHQGPDNRLVIEPVRADLKTIVVLRYKLAVPTEDGVWRDDGIEALENLPRDASSLRGQPATLVIGEPQLSVTELLSENAVLLEKILDHGMLPAVDPAGAQAAS